MKTHRFTGATSREVLHKVKQALGDDALILSNRAVNGGIEVVAVSSIETDDAAVQPVRRSRVEIDVHAPRVSRAPSAASRADRYADDFDFADDEGYIDGLS